MRSIFCLKCLPFRETSPYAEALLPGKWQNITCWWEVENNLFFNSLLLNAPNFSFALVNWLISTYKLFSFLWPAVKGNGRVVWWSPGYQSRSAHHQSLRTRLNTEHMALYSLLHFPLVFIHTGKSP